eukprot:jgi/Ulvmu1/5640/UM231_0003.1
MRTLCAEGLTAWPSVIVPRMHAVPPVLGRRLARTSGGRGAQLLSSCSAADFPGWCVMCHHTCMLVRHVPPPAGPAAFGKLGPTAGLCASLCGATCFMIIRRAGSGQLLIERRTRSWPHAAEAQCMDRRCVF